MKKKENNGTNPYIDQTKCPIVYAMEIIGSKWKLPILWNLMQEDGLHYNEIRRRIKGITNTMLSKCLKELERSELISRHSYETIPPSVSYHLTELGKQLIPSLNTLYTWGETHITTTNFYDKND